MVKTTVHTLKSMAVIGTTIIITLASEVEFYYEIIRHVNLFFAFWYLIGLTTTCCKKNGVI